MFASDPLKTAQDALGMKRRDDLFARLLDISEEHLRAASSGESQARSEALQAAALILGLEPHELEHEDLRNRASVVLLKSLVDLPDEATFREIIEQGVHRELGRFVRALRRKTWLRRTLRESPSALPAALSTLVRPTPPEGERPPYGANDLASRVRACLSLGDDPIPSMVELVREQLHIEIRATDTLWRSIDGASYSFGTTRGILVNLSDTPGPARTRMTLAHELCHVLFDGGAFAGASGALLIFSPEGRDEAQSQARRRSPGVASIPRDFRLREQRANAFAASFLAPPTGVRALFGRYEPPMVVETVDQLAAYYGLSRLAAVNVLQNTYGWSYDNRANVLDLLDCSSAPAFNPRFSDSLSVTPDPDAETRALAQAAVASGLMFRSMHDQWLGIETQRVAPPPLAGDHPRGHWTHAPASDVAEEILAFSRADKTAAALRVLWDALHDWIRVRDFERSADLLLRLDPAQVNDDVILNLLTITRDVPELTGARTGYLQRLRDGLKQRQTIASSLLMVLANTPQR